MLTNSEIVLDSWEDNGFLVLMPHSVPCPLPRPAHPHSLASMTQDEMDELTPTPGSQKPLSVKPLQLSGVQPLGPRSGLGAVRVQTLELHQMHPAHPCFLTALTGYVS